MKSETAPQNQSYPDYETNVTSFFAAALALGYAKNSQMRTTILISAVILSAGFIAGTTILGQKLYQARKTEQYVSVKGLAEKEVKADQGSWLISATYSGNELLYLKNEVNEQVLTIKSWLEENGFGQAEMKVDELSIQENIYGQAQARYTINLRISVLTDKVDLLNEISGHINQLIDRGVPLSGDRWLSRPRYYFTDINSIKPELLAEATRAALVSAEEFAQHSGAAVGAIRRANQGIITLIPASRITEEEEFYLHKIARVVSSFDYYIK